MPADPVIAAGIPLAPLWQPDPGHRRAGPTQRIPGADRLRHHRPATVHRPWP
jgi:hypothetical protein